MAVRLIAGEAFGARANVKIHSPLFYLHCEMPAGASGELPAGYPERALYILDGDAQLDGADLPARHLVVLERGVRHVLRARSPLRAMLLGGEPLDGRRHLRWL